MDIHAFRRLSDSENFQTDCSLYASKIKNDDEVKERFGLKNLDLFKGNLKLFHKTVAEALKFIETRKANSKVRRARKKALFDFAHEDENCLITATDDPKFSRAAGSLLKGADSCPWCTAQNDPSFRWWNYYVEYAFYIYQKKKGVLVDAWTIIVNYEGFLKILYSSPKGSEGIYRIETLKNNVGFQRTKIGRTFGAMLRKVKLSPKDFYEIAKETFERNFGIKHFKNVLLEESIDKRKKYSFLERQLKRHGFETYRKVLEEAYADAAKSDNLNLLKWCLKQGVDMEYITVSNWDYKKRGWGAMHLAAINDSLKVLKYLIKNGAKTNSLSVCNHTPLLEAVFSGNAKSVELLLKSGINPKNPEEKMALGMAVGEGSEEVLNLLLKYGADVDGFNYYGETALYRAVLERRNHMVRILVEHGADLKCRQHHRKTLLHAAVLGVNKEIIPFLLENGVNPNLKDNDGKTPYQLAVSLGRGYITLSKRLASQLKKHGYSCV